jgi:hypothetical protein
MVRRFSEASRFRESLAATGEEAAASERRSRLTRQIPSTHARKKESGFRQPGRVSPAGKRDFAVPADKQ